MGFRYFNLGLHRPCRMENGTVIEVLPSGMEVSYYTTLKETIPQQCNKYYGRHILFYLTKEGLDYVGRRDGTVSVYNGDLLVYWGNWDAPFSKIVEAGYTGTRKSIKSIYLDLRDRRTFYLEGSECEYVYPEEIQESFDTHKSLLECSLYQRQFPYYVIGSGGEHYVLGEWSVPADSRFSTYRVFL